MNWHELELKPLSAAMRWLAKDLQRPQVYLGSVRIDQKLWWESEGLIADWAGGRRTDAKCVRQPPF
jgi:hypothetical protein